MVSTVLKMCIRDRLISADILISGRERFKGKKIVELPMKVVLNSPKGVLNKNEEKLKGAE